MSGKSWSDFVKAFPESPEATASSPVPLVVYQCSCDDRKRRGQMFLTPTHLYFYSQMLGVLKVSEELAKVTTVEEDPKDKINKAIFVNVDKEGEEPAHWKFLSFREDAKKIIATIHAMSAAARSPPSPEEPTAEDVEEEEPQEEEETEEDVQPEAQPEAQPGAPPATQPSVAEEERAPRPAPATPSSPQLRQRPPGLSVPGAHAEASKPAPSASVEDLIRQRKLKEKQERQQYADRLRQKAESQAKAASGDSSEKNGKKEAAAPAGSLEVLLGLLPLTKRFLALFGLIFVSTCFILPNSVRTDTWSDIFAAALFLAALDVSINPTALAGVLAKLTRPYLEKHKSQPAVAVVADSLQLIYVPLLHLCLLWLVELLLPGFSTGFFSALLGVLAINIPGFVSPNSR